MITFDPSIAFAEAIDTVMLRNGGMYRGHVSEVVPGDHVTVRVVGQTELKVIPWTEVDRVILGGASAPPATSTTTTAPPVLPPPPPSDADAVHTLESAGPRVTLHISSPKEVILYHRAVGTTSWKLACRSPCDLDLPADGGYRIEGNGTKRSKEFSLQQSPDSELTLQIKPASAGVSVLGAILIAGGGVVMLGGLAVADSRSASDGDRGTGLIALGLGAALAVTGIFINRFGSTTDVEQVPTTTKRKAEPVWSERASFAASTLFEAHF